MSLLWFFLGALVAVCIVGVRSWIKGNHVYVSVLSWLGIVVGGLLFFTSAWCITSFVEGEIRAVMMGLLFFGVPGIIVLVLTGRNMMKSPS